MKRDREREKEKELETTGPTEEEGAKYQGGEVACVHHASGPHACKDGSSPRPFAQQTGKRRSSWLTGLTGLTTRSLGTLQGYITGAIRRPCT